jgi:hypothetical protein
MKHEPKAFGRVDWQARARADRRRQAAYAATFGGLFALAFAAATGVAMRHGSEGAAAVFAICAACALMVAVAAASEA